MPVKTPDPMDLPEPGYREGDNARFAKECLARVLADPDPPFTQAKILEDALVEWKARITDFHVQKNSGMVNWLLDNPPGNDLPPDLLATTQQYTIKTHPLEVHNYDA